MFPLISQASYEMIRHLVKLQSMKEYKKGEENMFCEVCGSEIEYNDAVCYCCGAHMGEEMVYPKILSAESVSVDLNSEPKNLSSEDNVEDEQNKYKLKVTDKRCAAQGCRTTQDELTKRISLGLSEQIINETETEKNNKSKRDSNTGIKVTCPKCGSENVKHSSSALAKNVKWARVCSDCGAKLGILSVKQAIIVAFIFFGAMFIYGSYNAPSSTSSAISPEQTASDNASLKSEAKTISYKDLARNPDSYKQAKVTYTGEVIQVQENGNSVALRVNVTKNTYGYEDTMYVTYDKSIISGRVLEKDVVTFWGNSNGLLTYKTIMGAEMTIPQVNGRIITVN